MKRSLILSCLLVFAPACDKKKNGDTKTPDGTVGATTEGTGADTGDTPDPEPFVPDVPQEPDPAEIAASAHDYLLGNYQKVIDTLQPLFDDLRDRKQYRASGLAGGWLALAHTEIVFENAEEASKYAMEMADKTGDPEVVALAKISHGAFLLENQDYSAATVAFQAAGDALSEGKIAALADIFKAESLINTAFGHGTSTKVEKPEDLERAKEAYAEARELAAKTDDNDAILGHIEEGLAAIAEYQRKKDDICAHSLKAAEHYGKAGAAELAAAAKGKAKDLKCGK